MGALDFQSWEHRISFVMERYRQKDKALDSQQLFEKAFATLESLCVGEEAEESLHVSLSYFFKTRDSRHWRISYFKHMEEEEEEEEEEEAKTKLQYET
jgi:hypothetical protein